MVESCPALSPSKEKGRSCGESVRVSHRVDTEREENQRSSRERESVRGGEGR